MLGPTFDIYNSIFFNLCLSIPESWFHLTLKRRAEISADIFACWSVWPRRPPKRCCCGWVPIYVCTIFLCLVVEFRPRFHSAHLAPSEFSCLKRQTTLLNIRSDPMATWECAKQVQASPQLLGKRNACALHFKELKKNSHRSRRCTSVVC